MTIEFYQCQSFFIFTILRLVIQKEFISLYCFDRAHLTNHCHSALHFRCNYCKRAQNVAGNDFYLKQDKLTYKIAKYDPFGK